MSYSDKLKELGIDLPEVPAPVASYVPAVRTGKLVFVSGQLPFREGKLDLTGLVGAQVDPAAAAGEMRQAFINALAAVNAIAGIDKVVKIVRLVGYVACVPEFTGQSAVVNGASDVCVEIFGDAGRHARLALGAPSLPLNSPVELELIVEVSD